MYARITTVLVFLLCLSRAATAGAAGPPSGEIPILYNDHTVYAKPDLLDQSRVLAALVKDGQIYVPLRSMFEQMGATVSASPDGRTVTAEKPGASVSVTLGKSEVVVNGETRPLDVPPMLYHGIMLVPVRVLSEALGAYVQWVPERRIVVVRYIAAPPPPVPTAPPTVAPTATPVVVMPPPPPAPVAVPTAAPVQRSYTAFIDAAYSTPMNYNEFVAGGYCDTYLLSAVFAPQDSPFAVKADFRQDTYVTSSNATDAFGNHYTQFATIDGGTAFAPVFMAHQSTLDVRLEYRVAAPRIYVGVGYLHTSDSYGYPQLNGFGGGIEKLPDLRPGVSVYGSAFYYPSETGTYTVNTAGSPNAGVAYQQRYQIMKYDIGLALVIAHSPVYVHGGYSADQYFAKQNAPIGQVHAGPYIGLGLKM